jgi:maltose alpha-D-glucosyltransferase/alpha-amylase
VLVDFEGEPTRSQEERRRKHSPLRDVAGLLRSLAYARHAAELRCASDSAEDCARWAGLLLDWEQQAREQFLAGYDEIAKGRIYDTLKSVATLIDAFELEKALYEVRYELSHRPEWAVIPISSLVARNA